MEKKLRRNIIIFYLHQIFRASLFQVPIWYVYQEQFLSVSKIGFYTALSWIISLLFELPSGALADIIGRKNTINIGALLMGIAFIILGISPTESSMIIYTILVGLGIAFTSGSNSAILYDSLKELKEEEKFPEYLAKGSFFFQFMGSISIILGGYMYITDQGLPFIARGGFHLLFLPIGLLFTEPNIDSTKFGVRRYVNHLKIGIKESFKNAYLAKLSIFFVLVAGIGIAGHRFFEQIFMVEIGMDDVTRGWVAAGIKLSVAFTTILIARNKKLFRSKNFLLILPIIMIISYLPIQFIGFPFAIPFIFGVALPSGTRNVFIGTFINDGIDSKYRATSLSTLNLLVSGLFAFITIIGGVYVEKYSAGEFYFIFGLIALLIALPLALNIIRIKSKTEVLQMSNNQSS